VEKRSNLALVVILVIVVVLAVGLAIWQYKRSQPPSEIPASAYPQPQTGQPTVEQVGPPPDVVPAGTPGSPATPPPIKGR
jgi:hypothetical protein